MKRFFAIALLLAAGLARAQTTTTSNMRLVLPVPGQRPGPQWASDLVTALQLIDLHDHTSGKGLRVPVSGLNINGDFSANGYNLTLARSVRVTNQSSALTLPADIRSLYSVAGDLYWNNGSGTAVRLTSGAGLNAASIGGIGGDYVGSGATVYYMSSAKTYYFDSSSSVRGGVALGPLYLYDPQAGGHYVQFQAPTGLAGNYQLTLPAALPASSSPLMVSTTGQVTATPDVTLTGALTVPGATTLNGSATLNGAVTATNGLTISAGDLSLTQAADQHASKSGGALLVGTTDNHSTTLFTNNTARLAIDGSGAASWTGGSINFNSHALTALPAPSGLTDAATKGYVDGGIAFTGKSTAPATVGGDGSTTLSTKGYVDFAAATTPRTGTVAVLGSDFGDGAAQVWNVRSEFDSPSYPAHAVVTMACLIKHSANIASTYNQYVAPHGPAGPIYVVTPNIFVYTNGTLAPALTLTTATTAIVDTYFTWVIVLGNTGGVIGLQFQHDAVYTTIWRAGSYCVYW